MQAQPVRQLTRGALVNILMSAGQSRAQPYQPIIQITDYKIAQNKNAKQECLKGTASDGYAKFSKTFFAQTAAIKLKELPENSKPIVQIIQHIAQLNNDKNTHNFIIMNIEIIYPTCEDIGEPMEYQQYLDNAQTNPQGSCEIPAYLYSRGAQGANVPQPGQQPGLAHAGTLPRPAAAPGFAPNAPPNAQGRVTPQASNNPPGGAQPRTNVPPAGQLFPGAMKPSTPAAQFPQAVNQPFSGQKPPQQQPPQQQQQWQQQQHPPQQQWQQQQQPPQQQWQQQQQQQKMPNNAVNNNLPPNANRPDAQGRPGAMGARPGQPAQYQAPPPQQPLGANNPAVNAHTRRGPVASIQQGGRSSNTYEDGQYRDILSLYTGQQVIIKARVTRKSDMRSFMSKSSKPGKVFSIDLIDLKRGEINGSFFGEEADKFYESIHEGTVYEIIGGDVQQKRGPGSPSQQYQIVFNKDTKINELFDDGSIPVNNFNFRPIQDIVSLDKDSVIDIIGVVKSSQQPQPIKLKNGDSKYKKVMNIYDQSMHEVEVTLWGGDAERNDLQPGVIIAIRNARIGEYMSQKNVSLSFTSMMHVHTPQKPLLIDEVTTLEQWAQTYDPSQTLNISAGQGNAGPGGAGAGGGNFKLQSILDIETACVGQENNEQFKKWTDVHATIATVRTEGTLYYLACPICMKKVIPNPNESTSYCEKDNQVVVPKARYIASALIKDSTSQMWVNIYDEVAQKILQMSAEDARAYKEGNQDNILKDIVQEQSNREFVCKVLSVTETFGGQMRIKHQIKNLIEVNHKKESNDMLSQIQEYIPLLAQQNQVF